MVVTMTEQQLPQQYETPQWLTPHQIEALSQPLDMHLIRHRKGAGGRMLAYVAGKTDIDTANRIFGFGGWGTKVIARSRETCMDGKKGEMTFYTCDIELSVVGAAFPFPGDGVGIVNDPYTIEMHEKARKDAYTDALKRALRHYGDQFALCLYDPDDYVQAPDGSQIQVKEVPINDGKHQPRQIVDAGGHKQIAEKRCPPPLDEQIKQAKLRAKKLDLAHDAAEWAALLEASGVTVITHALDLAKVNGHMTAIERGVLVVHEDEIIVYE
jgi:DNA repair and recombination protein RAD52